MTTRRTDQNKKNDQSGTQARGFASMPHDKVQDIATKGGHASAEKAGHQGMAERGRKGGSAPHSSRPGRTNQGEDNR